RRQPVVDEQHSVAGGQFVAEHQPARPFSIRISDLHLVTVPLELYPFAARAGRGEQAGGAQQQEMGEGADRAHGAAPWTGLAAPSGKPARAVKAAGATTNSSIPLPKSGRRVHNARPAKERSAQAGRAWRRRTKKALHKVLTFSETALECAAPLTGRPPGPNIRRTRKIDTERC